MNLLERLLNINLMVFDLDGVLTNGKVLLSTDGEWLRQMDIKDGFAIQFAIKSGIKIAVVSGSYSNQVEQRLKKLGVEVFVQGATRKSEHLLFLLEKLSSKKDNLLYMGDDIPDLDAFIVSGIKTCPADAVSEIKDASDIISLKNGGDGCVREIIEKVMRVQGKWDINKFNIQSV
jgi:3-deoxy-D-manno-octulosonate 8-phosphate phosphatase (KDO 8-P phosphatase)